MDNQPLLPQVEMHADWKSWARALLPALRPLFAARNTVNVLPSYPVARLPTAAKNGLIVFVTDDVNGPQPVYSAGGQWLRFTDGTETSAT